MVISAMNDGKRFWLNQGGDVIGPFSVSRLRELLQDGEARSHEQVCLDGTEHWLELRDVIGRAPQKVAVPVYVPSDPKRPWYRRKLGVIGKLLSFSALVLLLVVMCDPDDQEHQSALPEGFSEWDGSHRASIKTIKALMHDPGSFKHVETRFTTDFIYTKYRGKNQLGAVILNESITDHDGNLIRFGN